MISRLYEKIIADHIATCRQMIFLPGPRQVGKTTLAKLFMQQNSTTLYLNWDNKIHRKMIQGNLKVIVKELDLDGPSKEKRLLICDEIHKYPLWKNWLKGVFDTYEDKLTIIVTGSAMLNVYRKGQDSMMGRYYSYRIHPLSVAEILGRANIESEVGESRPIADSDFQALRTFGGFPEPYTTRNTKKHFRWSNEREELLFTEDMRDLSRVQEISQIQLLADILKEQIAQNTSYASLSRKIQVAAKTVKKWLNTLEFLYYAFSITPWTKNITRSLIKEPKYYLWDWSQVHDEGARNENFVASHLLKAVHYWTDLGLGKFELHYLRDKEKREVDFLVTKNREPWFLVEVKTSNDHSISPALGYFQKLTGAPHAFQVVFNRPFVAIDCFAERKPVIIPVQVLLSQLV